MKKKISIYIAILTIIACNFSKKENIGSYLDDMKYSTLLKYIEKDKLLFKDTFILPYDYNMPKKEIIDGYMVEIIEHFKREPNFKKKEDTITNDYKIKLIYKDNEIIFYELNKIKNIKNRDKWFTIDSVISTRKNEQSFKEISKKYTNLYGGKLNLNELFNTKHIYGKSCSFSGMNPKHRTEINKIILAKDFDKILVWLKSPIIEIQLYAVEAIYKLGKMDVEIPRDFYHYIKQIEKKKGYVNTCSGCYYEYKKISEVIGEIKMLYNTGYN